MRSGRSRRRCGCRRRRSGPDGAGRIDRQKENQRGRVRYCFACIRFENALARNSLTRRREDDLEPAARVCDHSVCDNRVFVPFWLAQHGARFFEHRTFARTLGRSTPRQRERARRRLRARSTRGYQGRQRAADEGSAVEVVHAGTIPRASFRDESSAPLFATRVVELHQLGVVGHRHGAEHRIFSGDLLPE